MSDNDRIVIEADEDRIVIELVDAPDKGADEYGIPNRESQRSYRITRALGVRHVVRIRRSEDSVWQYVIENLVGGKWSKLLDGSLEGDRGLDIPFDKAVRRAAMVLVG